MHARVPGRRGVLRVAGWPPVAGVVGATAVTGARVQQPIGPEAASCEQIAPPSITRVVAKLETDGLVEHSMCTEDRRCVYATLTPTGLKLYRSARPTHREVLREHQAV